MHTSIMNCGGEGGIKILWMDRECRDIIFGFSTAHTHTSFFGMRHPTPCHTAAAAALYHLLLLQQLFAHKKSTAAARKKKWCPSTTVVVVVVVFTLTDRASTIPSNIRGCQSGTWSRRGTKVNGSHHGDNPLLTPTGIQIATKSYATLQAMAPTNGKTVHQTSFTPYREQRKSVHAPPPQRHCCLRSNQDHCLLLRCPCGAPQSKRVSLVRLAYFWAPYQQRLQQRTCL